MGRRLTSDEMTEWQAFYVLEPWGTAPAALNTAIVTATIANVNRAPTAPPYSPVDFMPVYGLPKPKVELTDEERSNQIRNLLKRE